MSVRAITLVLDKSQHAGTNLLMLVVLADYSDDDGNSYPAVASLARKCRMTPRNAQYILQELQASGELRVLKNEGPKGCNRYRINLASSGTVTPMKPIAPLKAASGVKPTSPGGETGFAKGVKPTSPEPSLNRHRTVNGHSDLFDLFWLAYPRKVKKKEAQKAFEKIRPTPELVDQMLAALRWQVPALKWVGDQYTPHPASWLNGERWLDEPQGNAVKSSRHPQWALDAGFANIDEAHNERCYQRNAHEFRDGKRIQEVIA